MDIHNITSESEEMYLVTLALLQEAGEEAPFPVSQIAQELSIQPVSANQMIRKLEATGLVEYLPYHGVALTSEGRRVALRILRHRRLWEVFLFEQLRISAEEASELACRLEHTMPEEAAERLAVFLGDPVASPSGKTIPGPAARTIMHEEISLDRLRLGEERKVTRIEEDGATQAFLLAEGLRPGSIVSVSAIGDRGAVLVRTGGRSVKLSEELACRIWVSETELHG